MAIIRLFWVDNENQVHTLLELLHRTIPTARYWTRELSLISKRMRSDHYLKPILNLQISIKREKSKFAELLNTDAASSSHEKWARNMVSFPPVWREVEDTLLCDTLRAFSWQQKRCTKERVPTLFSIRNGKRYKYPRPLMHLEASICFVPTHRSL